jgi:asparagine N-glycosylation enzyme membrane subunit Stt3
MRRGQERILERLQASQAASARAREAPLLRSQAYPSSMRSVSRQTPLAYWLALGAVAWTVLLAIGAFWLPAYRGSTCETSYGVTHCSSTGSTLVGENGAWSVVWFAVPMLAALGVWFLLARGRNERHRSIAAVLLVSVCGLFVIVTVASIGLLELPAVLLLVSSALLVGQRTTPQGPRRTLDGG